MQAVTVSFNWRFNLNCGPKSLINGAKMKVLLGFIGPTREEIYLLRLTFALFSLLKVLMTLKASLFRIFMPPFICTFLFIGWIVFITIILKLYLLCIRIRLVLLKAALFFLVVKRSFKGKAIIGDCANFVFNGFVKR